MLTSLSIRNFVLVESLDLDFSLGLTTMTGETGAGKSIVLDAIGLLLGDRGDGRFIRSGADRCELAMIYDAQSRPSVREQLIEHGIPLNDDDENELHIRRVIASNGRSRCYINGSSQPVSHLKTIGEMLIDIHGQNDHQSLVRAESQRALLDAMLPEPALASQVATDFAQYRERCEKLEAIQSGQAELEQQIDFLKFQLEELTALELSEGEVEALDAEQKTRSHSETLLSTSEHTLQLLREQDQSLEAQLNHCVIACQKLADIEPAMRESGELLESALININEAAETLSRYRSNADADPERLQWIETRLSDIFRLAKKHHVLPESLHAHQQTLTENLEKLEQDHQDPETLALECEKQLKKYQKSAQKLSMARQKTGASLSSKITDIMQNLSMAGGSFEVKLEKNSAPSAHGDERVRFFVAANPGQPAGPMGDVASGGEMSRISLAIQVASAGAQSTPTLIFDEIDTGIGGQTAAVVGKRLRELASHQQIFSVTHLPQVAASGHQQLQIRKHTENGQTHTTVTPLEQTARIDELARMLGGDSTSESARANAQELLAQQTQD